VSLIKGSSRGLKYRLQNKKGSISPPGDLRQHAEDSGKYSFSPNSRRGKNKKPLAAKGKKRNTARRRTLRREKEREQTAVEKRTGVDVLEFLYRVRQKPAT